MNLIDARILVVDDEPLLLELYPNWLRAIGCGKIFTAANGAEALTLLQDEAIDLLLTDVRMPVMDGITLVRRLAELGRTVLSIIFVSGFGDIDQREMYAVGVEAFLGKPFDRTALLPTLEKAVAKRSDLWQSAMATSPRQSLLIEANRVGAVASHDTIGLGRGGFSVCTLDPIILGKVSFRLVLADPATEIIGQGYVRWFSRSESKAGIEFAFLDSECHAWLTEAIVSTWPRSFIPGS